MQLQANFQKGDKVAFSLADGTTLTGTYSHHAPNQKAYIRADNGVAYERVYSKIRKIGEAVTDFELNGSNVAQSATITPPSVAQFDINQRFDFLQQLVRMVVNNTSVSMIITGEGGLGKTYTVKREIRRKRLEKEEDFIYIKGFSTAKGLYKTLYENNGKLIVFDDCDEILKNDIALNILKGALDSYDERTIYWINSSMIDDGIPQSFEFTGRVIFISNKAQSSIDQALLSRSMCIDLTMSREDKLKRMRFIVENSKEFMPHVEDSIKEECFDVIEENLSNVRELSLRSLEKVVKVRLGEIIDNKEDEEEDTDGKVTTDWKTLAKYLLIN